MIHVRSCNYNCKKTNINNVLRELCNELNASLITENHDISTYIINNLNNYKSKVIYLQFLLFVIRHIESLKNNYIFIFFFMISFTFGWKLF